MPVVMDNAELGIIKRIAETAKQHLVEAADRYSTDPTRSNYRDLVKRQSEYQMAYNEVAALYIPVG